MRSGCPRRSARRGRSDSRLQASNCSTRDRSVRPVPTCGASLTKKPEARRQRRQTPSTTVELHRSVRSTNTVTSAVKVLMRCIVASPKRPVQLERTQNRSNTVLTTRPSESSFQQASSLATSTFDALSFCTRGRMMFAAPYFTPRRHSLKDFSSRFSTLETPIDKQAVPVSGDTWELALPPIGPRASDAGT